MRRRGFRQSLSALVRALVVVRALTAGDTFAADGVSTHATSELPSRTIRELEQERRKAKPKSVDDKKKDVDEKEEGDPSSGRVIVPLVLYSPETHIAFGGLVIQFFRIGDAPKDSRVSSIAADALVTTRRQAIFELLPDLYWDNEDNHVFGKLEYQRFPDSFWGIGPHTPDSAEERYERERLRLRTGLLRRVHGPLYAGIYDEIMYYEGKYPDPNGTFARLDVPGEEGGFTSGIGPMLTYDSRDNAVQSRAGTLLSLTWLGFGPFVGSQHDFWKLQTEARHFFPLGALSALGFRYYGEFQGGSVPFYHMAQLGGDELLRGYFMGRYRDKNLVVLESEFRFPLFWRFGAVAFAGAGDVAEKFVDLAKNPIRWAVGGGLRLSINTKERLNLRLDVGVGPHTYGVYFTAAEAF
jgi:hypothetical protein